MSTTHADLVNAPPPPAPLTPQEIAAYLDYALDGLQARRTEILYALEATLAAAPRIDDDETLGMVAENVKMALTLEKTAEARRKEQKEPFLAGGRAVDGWFKSFAAPLEAALQPVRATMDDYGIRKYAERRAKAQEAARIAAMEAEQAAERVAALMEQAAPLAPGQMNSAFDQAQSRASEAAAATALATARPAELTRTTGIYGTTSSLRSTWSWEVTDAGAIPRAYLQPDPDAIKAAMKQRDARGRPIAVVPGITWIETQTMGVR